MATGTIKQELSDDHPKSCQPGKGFILNPYVLVASLSLALVLAVAALVREARLRRALQKLLQRLILLWRSYANGEDRGDRDPHADDRRL